MGKFYDILNIKWNFNSEEVDYVKYDKWTKKHSVMIPTQSEKLIEFSSDVWKLFKQDFPEHCVDIHTTAEVDELEEMLNSLI